MTISNYYMYDSEILYIAIHVTPVTPLDSILQCFTFASLLTFWHNTRLNAVKEDGKDFLSKVYGNESIYCSGTICDWVTNNLHLHPHQIGSQR